MTGIPRCLTTAALFATLGACSGDKGATAYTRTEQLPCLEALFATCASGSCPQADGGDGTACGPTVVYDPVENECAAPTSGTRRARYSVYRPDGSLCYTSESSCGCQEFCEAISEVWKDANGVLVAHGQFGMTMMAACETGETCDSEHDSPGCGRALPVGTCVAGCP